MIVHADHRELIFSLSVLKKIFLQMVCSDYITTCQSLYNLKYIKQAPLAFILKWKNQI